MKVSKSKASELSSKAFNCPVEATLDVIGGKWKVVILFHLSRGGTHRFAEMRRKIPAVSERMLTQQLRQLQEDGIIHREIYREIPPRVEYSLTDYGKTLRPICDVMCEWGTRHLRKAGKRARCEQ